MLGMRRCSAIVKKPDTVYAIGLTIQIVLLYATRLHGTSRIAYSIASFTSRR